MRSARRWRRAATHCEVFVSGPKVQIDAATAFEPDVVVSCAEVPDGLLVPEPLIVVEVLSPSTRDKDFTVKLAGYAALPSVAHYLLVDTQRRLVVHHHRSPGEQEFRTSIARSGTLRLDPPGLDLDLDAIYAGKRHLIPCPASPARSSALSRVLAGLPRQDLP